jgi:hypothetical protein
MSMRCRICANEKQRKAVDKLIAEGLSDAAIARQLGLEAGKAGHTGRMRITRHRIEHVEKPARAIVAASSKGRDLIEQRQEAIAAAERGDTVASWLGLEAITRDLRQVAERLERNADTAERDGHLTSVAALSGQQLRAAETRAKLGGVGAFAPQRGDAAAQPMFSVNFVFSGEGRQPERVEMSATPVIEGEAQPVPGLPVGMRDAGRDFPAPVDSDDPEWEDAEEEV